MFSPIREAYQIWILLCYILQRVCKASLVLSFVSLTKVAIALNLLRVSDAKAQAMNFRFSLI